jgi:hypothetical protein
MKRVLLVLTFLLVLGGAAAFRAGVLAAQQPTPTPPPAPAPKTPDPLEEFVPHEKLGAESVVAFPVDI